MRGDKTGPEGKGPKTGRGLGYCSGSDEPGYLNPANSQGSGPGRGLGRLEISEKTKGEDILFGRGLAHRHGRMRGQRPGLGRGFGQGRGGRR